MSRYFVSFTYTLNNGVRGFGNCYMNLDKLDEESVRDAHKEIKELDSIYTDPAIISIVPIESSESKESPSDKNRSLAQKILKIQRDAQNNFGIVTAIEVLVESEVRRGKIELLREANKKSGMLVDNLSEIEHFVIDTMAQLEAEENE